LRLVDHFSDRIVFHSPDSSKDEALFIYSSNLNLAFEETQKSSKGVAIISDRSVKTSGSATAIAHIWRDNKVTNRLKMHTSNITLLEAELMAIQMGVALALENTESHKIIVIMDVPEAAKKNHLIRQPIPPKVHHSHC